MLRPVLLVNFASVKPITRTNTVHYEKSSTFVVLLYFRNIYVKLTDYD